jgi:small subunit ribosomal protein S20
MVKHKSALKAARQATRRTQRNRQTRSRYRTFLKNLREGLGQIGADKESARKLIIPMLDNLQSVVMKAASKNLIKKRTASRYISRLSARIHQALR